MILSGQYYHHKGENKVICDAFKLQMIFKSLFKARCFHILYLMHHKTDFAGCFEIKYGELPVYIMNDKYVSNQVDAKMKMFSTIVQRADLRI